MMRQTMAVTDMEADMLSATNTQSKGLASALALSGGKVSFRKTETYYTREAGHWHSDDLKDLQLAESRLIDIRSGKTRAIPLEDALRHYGMES